MAAPTGPRTDMNDLHAETLVENITHVLQSIEQAAPQRKACRDQCCFFAGSLTPTNAGPPCCNLETETRVRHSCPLQC